MPARRSASRLAGRPPRSPRSPGSALLPARIAPAALVALSAVLLLGAGWPGSALAGDPQKGCDSNDAMEEQPAVLRGRLSIKKGDDGTAQAVVQVGKTKFPLVGVDADEIKKLNRKYVTVSGRWKAVGDDLAGAFVVAADGQPKEQDGAGAAGTVRKENGALRLVDADGATIEVPRSAATKLKAFDGKHVRVAGFLEQGPTGIAVAKVSDVRRELLPGEREPTSEDDLLEGAWTGKLIAEKVPSGAPNTKPGDALAVAFVTKGAATKGAGKSAGRLFDTYDVVGYRVSKFKTKDRSAKVDLLYSFGKGDYTLTLRGAFDADWKTFKGDWTSGFLGSGTFELTFATPPKPSSTAR